MTSQPRKRIAVLIGAAVFLVHATSPVVTSFDSHWSVLVSLRIVHHWDTKLDAWKPLIRASPYNYAVECVDENGAAREYSPARACAGSLRGRYPIATPALAAPFVAALEAVVAIARTVAPPLVRSPGVVGAFFRGDFVQGHAVVELLIASFFIAVAAALLYLAAASFLPIGKAIAIALIFAFATPAWSTGSRSLGQHSASMLAIAATLWILVEALDRPHWSQFASLPAAGAFLIRPTNAVLLALVTLYIAVRYRRWLLRYCGFAVLLFAPWLAYNFAVYHFLLQPYFRGRSLSPAIPEALAGNLISPARGLFVFAPVFLFSVWGTIIAWREHWIEPLQYYLIPLIVLHWIGISMFADMWWAGHSYGPRFFSDMSPVLAFFLIPVLARPLSRPAVAGFTLTLIVSVFINGSGALRPIVHYWNTDPVNVDLKPSRVWDWKDPPFLRGITSR